jgi:hypothetical protein
MTDGACSVDRIQRAQLTECACSIDRRAQLTDEVLTDTRAQLTEPAVLKRPFHPFINVRIFVVKLELRTNYRFRED